MTGVPVIDLAPARTGGSAGRRHVAESIDAACCDIGFFAIRGHGVPDALVDGLRTKAHAFFELPLAEKLAARHPGGMNRGYHPVGAEPYYTSALGRRHFEPNIWPARPAGFADAVTAYYRAMSGVILDLMRLATPPLGVDEHFFDDKVNRSIGTMRLNYYPAQPHAPQPGQLRASPHTDYGGFTILSGEDVPGGLQVKTRGDAWIDVSTAPNTFVVNIGDLLMRWTNDRWLSNMHRVVNPPHDGGPSRARLSIAFFNHPNYDVMVECLPSQGPAKHAPVLSGDYRDLKYTKTGLTGAVRAS